MTPAQVQIKKKKSSSDEKSFASPTKTFRGNFIPAYIFYCARYMYGQSSGGSISPSKLRETSKSQRIPVDPSNTTQKVCGCRRCGCGYIFYRTGGGRYKPRKEDGFYSLTRPVGYRRKSFIRRKSV